MKISKRTLLRMAGTTGVLLCTAVLAACTNSAGTKLNYQTTPDVRSDLANFTSKNAPMASYWMPSQLLKWSASTDKNLAFNKSTVPLAKRIPTADLKLSNDTQNKQTKVVALTSLNSSTSGNPSRGNNTFGGNLTSSRMPFDYWQYVDTMVYWGGSMAEGTVVPPSADSIDESHENGVPILGTVFIPDSTQWDPATNYSTINGDDPAVGSMIDTMLQKDANGNFPFAQKLVDVAKAYGFDGWFFNAEGSKDLGKGNYGLKPEQTAEFKALIQQIHKIDPSLQIMWYDAMATDGNYNNYWQGQLDDKNATYITTDQNGTPANSMFIDFRWADASGNNLEKSANYATAHHLDPYNLFAGMELEATDDQPVTNLVGNWASLASSNSSTYTSIGLFRPDNMWQNAPDFDTFQQLESQLWVNSEANPSQSDQAVNGQETPGISHYVVEKSAITGTDFRTDFSLGNGYNWFSQGKEISNMDWSNRSLAGILPTYRWKIKNEGANKLTPSIDYTTAWEGGNSFKFMADMDAKKASTINLFETELKANQNTQFSVAMRSDNALSVSAVVTLSDGSVKTIKGNQQVKSNWSVISFDTKDLTGKIVTNLSLKVESDKAVTMNGINLGALTFSDNTKSQTTSVSDVQVTSKAFENEGTTAGISIKWKAPSSKDIDHYEIYQVNNGKDEFLGASNIPDFFVNALARAKNQTKSDFKVVPVNKQGALGQSADVIVNWPDNTIPKADFVANQTVVEPGTTVKFANESNAPSVKFKWTFEGANQTTSTAKNPSVTYSKAGTYKVTLTAENDKGKENTVTKTGFITVTADATAGFTNYALHMKTTVDGFTNDNEWGPNAVDGNVKTKWCAVGPAEHNITIDLGQERAINEVIIDHAEAGGESPQMNTKAYTVQVSNDDKTWTTVVNVTNNSAAVTKNSFPQTKARYVKLTAVKPTQGSDNAVRWYEIQVLGLKK